MPHHNFDPAAVLGNEKIRHMLMTEEERQAEEARAVKAAEAMADLNALVVGKEDPTDVFLKGILKGLGDGKA